MKYYAEHTLMSQDSTTQGEGTAPDIQNKTLSLLDNGAEGWRSI